MLPEERRQKIMELLTKNKSVFVKDLSEEFNVSDETIRRDFTLLESEGKLKKAHGGAYINTTVKNDIPINIRESIFKENKDYIGQLCAKEIKDGDTIFIDASTTAYYILPHIRHLDNVTIITNSLKVAEYAAIYNPFDFMLIGGKYDPITRSFLGPDTEVLLASYFADKAFISCRGLSEKGITDGNIPQGIIRQKMIKNSKETYLILDNTKFDLTSLYLIGDLDLINHIITDKKPSDKYIDMLEDKNLIY